MDPKPYLDYLDKEMTIMGILSAFCVAAPAGVLTTTISKDGTIAPSLWGSSHSFLLVGSIFCVIAAGLFYKQRSDLAWLYGQISLTQSQGGEKAELNKALGDWFKKADAWDTWWSYCCAFASLVLGFTEYCFGISPYILPTHWTCANIHSHNMNFISFELLPICAFFYCVLQSSVRIHYKYEDYVWRSFGRAIAKSIWRRK